MRGYLRTLAGQGRAVLVSSHLTSELEDTADHLVVAGRGRVIAGTSARQLLAAASGSRIRPPPPPSPASLTISNLCSERTVAHLTQHTIPFTEVTARRPALEQAYPELTRESAGFRAAGAASRTWCTRSGPGSGRSAAGSQG
jgi:ABC-2 type transport system ATP-binding protein